MGTPASSTGQVTFESPAALSLAVKAIDDWIGKANNGFPAESEYHGYYEIELGGWNENSNSFNFLAYSDREQNMTWQMEMFSKFCQTLPGVIDFQADIMVQGDSVCWNKEDNS